MKKTKSMRKKRILWQVRLVEKEGRKRQEKRKRNDKSKTLY
jgi:hypothetical protein